MIIRYILTLVWRLKLYINVNFTLFKTRYETAVRRAQMSKTRSCTVQCVCTPLQVQPPATASAWAGDETGGGAGSDSSYLTRHQSQSSPQKQVTLCCLLSLQKMSSSRRGRRLCLNSQCSAVDCVSIFLGAAACTAPKFYIFTEANMCTCV